MYTALVLFEGGFGPSEKVAADLEGSTGKRGTGVQHQTNESCHAQNLQWASSQHLAHYRHSSCSFDLKKHMDDKVLLLHPLFVIYRKRYWATMQNSLFWLQMVYGM